MWACRSPLDVAELDQRRQLALRAPPSARRGPRAAPARCRRSRGARRPRPRSRRGSTSPVSVSVMPCSETERPRSTASSRSCDVVGLGAGEVLQQVAEGGRRDDPQVDRDAVVGLGADAVWGPVCRRRRSAAWAARCSARPSAPRRWRSGRCPCRSRPSGGPSRRPRPGARAGCSRSAAASSSAIGRTFESSSRPGPSPGSPSRSSEASTFSSAFGPSPLTSRIFSSSAACFRSSSVAICELVAEQARGFRPEPGDARHFDQGRREFRLQLHRRRDLAGVEQGVDLFRQRLADAGDLGRPARRGQLVDRDRAFADRLGGGGVGEDAVLTAPSSS